VSSRGGLVAFWLLLAYGGIANSQSLPNQGCSLPAFETRPDAAAEACTAILNAGGLSDRGRADALKIRARSSHIIGRLDDAISDYELALGLAPDDPELHLRRGWTAYDKQDFDLARGQAEQALKLKPEYAGATDLIGAVLAHPSVRRLNEARAAYNEAIRADPADPLFRYHLFQLLEYWVSTPAALEAANALLQMPVGPITRPNAITYYRKMTTFRTAVTLERGNLLAALGKLDDARASFDQAIKDDPGALSYAWRAAFLLERSALPTPMDQVQADLDRSLAADASYWFSLGLAGRVHFYGKDYDAAAAEFVRSIELYPINGSMRWWHAMTLRMLGRADEAAAEAVTAFEVDPGFMSHKVADLRKYGFLLPVAPKADPRPMLLDAARACMLDDRCR
jgi:tetratricopeptide (TPR) repeat protein